MQHINIITRRGFLDHSFKVGLGVALSTLVDIPFVMKRALAEGSIGLNGKKLLFIFFRGANDGLNSIIPIQDSAYNLTNRPTLMIKPDAGTIYTDATGKMDFPQSSSVSTDPNYSPFWYTNAIRAGNGYAAVHPSLKFLAPGFNLGNVALIHRVGYPKQSRSHFDSQNYWENGNPNNNLVKDGIFYRTMVQSGLANSSPLTGVSIQSALPLSLRGSAAAMTNLSDPTRYNLLGIPNNPAGNSKADGALSLANGYPFSDKQNRDLLALQYGNMAQTLSIFASLDFSEAGNTFRDDANTDGDTQPYYLFPTSNAKNGGYQFHANDTKKYVVDTGAYSFFTNLKAAAIVLNKTDAIIAGTEMSGFDTHSSQGAFVTAANNPGTHPHLMSRIAWAMYALQKYFTTYRDRCEWNNLVVVTLSEFGRTSIENGNAGTDHAEASAMFLAGGAVNGGVYGCNTTDNYNGQPVQWVPGQAGSMFGVQSRYLKRIFDYRSLLGKLVRDHLGATQNQLNTIIPGYAVAGERLQSGGVSSVDTTTIAGEIPIV